MIENGRVVVLVGNPRPGSRTHGVAERAARAVAPNPYAHDRRPDRARGPVAESDLERIDEVLAAWSAALGIR
jgi:NAD(P)H-dependent FMN reductase